MSEELLPCPFCGGEAELIARKRRIPFVECARCGIEQDGVSVERAIAAWNTRPALIDHLEADGGVEAMRERLVQQARRVRNYSSPAEVFEAVPLRFVLEECEVVNALPVLGVGR